MSSSTYDKLEYLNETKARIRQAIIRKGQSVGVNDTFRSYADKIDAISSGAPINNQNIDVTSNGQYTAEQGYTGLGTVNVNVQPTLENKEITSNGTYYPGNIYAYHFGLGWNGKKESYTGEYTLVGDYMWFRPSSPFGITVGTEAYNGKLENDEVVPNFEEELGKVTDIREGKYVKFNFIQSTRFVPSNDPIEINGYFYFKTNVQGSKEDSSVPIVGDYVWVESKYPSIMHITNGDVYNSTDASDTAPDLSAPIGIVVYIRGYRDFWFDFSNNAFNTEGDVTSYAEVIGVYDGMGRVDVNVAPRLSSLNINNNGDYYINDYNKYRYYGIAWGDNKQYYTGSSEIVGPYMWFWADPYYPWIDLPVYNGKWNDDRWYPDFDNQIGTVSDFSDVDSVTFDFIEGHEYDVDPDTYETIGDDTFLKFYINNKQDSSVSIVGDYLWVKFDPSKGISKEDLVYNSTDSSDTAPDLTSSIGTVDGVYRNKVLGLSCMQSGHKVKVLIDEYIEEKWTDGWSTLHVNVAAQPNLGGINISNNGTYRIDDYKRTYYGMSNTGIRDIYIGSSTLAGNYVWFDKSTGDLQVGDVIYNGTDNSDVPNLNDILGQVSAVDYDKKIGVSFLPEENLLAVSDENAIKIDGTYYIKIYCHYKSQSSVNIVGDYVWVKADDYWKINVGDNVYNSTDTSDTAPDLNAGSIGTVSYKWSTKIIRFSFTPSQYGFMPNDEITWSNNIDGWDKIDVNVIAQPSLKDETFTQNGVYTVSPRSYIGLAWFSEAKQAYTGSSTLVGDYIWLNSNNPLNEVQEGDFGYNGKIENDKVVPNFNDPIGEISSKSIFRSVEFDFLPSYTNYIHSGNYVVYNDLKYFRVYIHYIKQHSSVPIVGDYVWIRADNLYEIVVGSDVYNSTDSSDTAPDLSAPIGEVTNVGDGAYFDFNTVPGYMFTYPAWNNGVYTEDYQGYGTITVDVPSSQPVLKDETFTQNGVYKMIPGSHTYTGLQLWEGAIQNYTGSTTIVGDYLWFKRENILETQIGDLVYNGKLEDGRTIPNFEESLGEINNIAMTRKITLDILTQAIPFVVKSYNYHEVNGEGYYLISIDSWLHEYLTVQLTGDCVWIKADSLGNITEESPIYNSTDSSDTAPDLSASIGHPSSAVDMIEMNVDTFTSSLFQYPWGETSTYTETNLYQGYDEVTVAVDVPLLKDETFTQNGVYSLSPETHTYVALAWWGDSKQAYTGSSTLVGDYIWFHTDDFYDPEIGDSVYNGQIVDGQTIPNFEDAISTIRSKTITSEFQVSFLPTNWDLNAYNPPIEFNGLNYFKVGIHPDAKAISSVSIVGDKVWIRADKLEDIVEGTLIYNSTDSSDTAPDTTTSIGTVTSNDNMSVSYQFADVSGYGFRYYKYAQTSSYTETKNWGGYRQVTVDVPSASGTVVQATNNTGSNIAEGVRVWIRPTYTESVNYDQTSGVTIVDGIATSSTSGQCVYTQLTNAIPQESYEQVLCIKNKQEYSESYQCVCENFLDVGDIGAAGYGFNIGFMGNAVAVCLLPGDSSSNAMYPYNHIADNQYVWLKVYIDNTKAVLSYSEDGINYTDYYVYNGSSCFNALQNYTNNYFCIGDNNNIFEINLNECYIKVDGNVIWKPERKTVLSSCAIYDKNDISVNDLTAVTIEPINDQQTGRVQTLLDGIGSYAPSTSSKTIYTNGTFRADAENLYGYDKIIVDVAGGGTNQDMTFPVDGVYTAGQGYSGLGTVTVIAGETAQKRMAEDLMLVNDGETEFTLTVSPSTANVSIISNTNQIGIVPSSSSSGVYTFNISADSLKTYNYTISNPGYETVSGSISGGTSSMVVTLDEESGI